MVDSQHVVPQARWASGSPGRPSRLGDHICVRLMIRTRKTGRTLFRFIQIHTLAQHGENHAISMFSTVVEIHSAQFTRIRGAGHGYNIQPRGLNPLLVTPYKSCRHFSQYTKIPKG